MARPLPILLVNDSSTLSSEPSSGLILTFLAIIFIFSTITNLCADHRSRTSDDQNHTVSTLMASTSDESSHDHGQSADHDSHRSFLSSLRRNASTKAILKVITWGKVQHDHQDEAQKQKGVDDVRDDHDAYGDKYDDHDDVDDDYAVWRKGIIMGERCKPLNISGKIEYDSRGNPLRVQQQQEPERDFIGNWGSCCATDQQHEI
ncbi:hypothetical protein Ancab_034850 [Ancistrocladus abbreviatus]